VNGQVLPSPVEHTLKTRSQEEFAGGPEIRRVTLDGRDDVLVATGGYSPAIGPDGRIGRTRRAVGADLALLL